MPIRPWTKVGELEIVIEDHGRFFAFQRFVDNKGKDINFSLLGGVTKPSIVLPVTTDNKVIVVRQFRPGANNILMELPGGNPDEDNELPENVVARELMEETGYKAGRIIQLSPEKMFFDPSVIVCEVHGFVALDCELVKQPKPDEDEEIEVLTIPLKDWIRIAQNEIGDFKTAAITLKALPYLGIDINSLL